jgi:hypothetical protein
MVEQLVSETIQTINLLSGTANLFAEHVSFKKKKQGNKNHK